MKSRHRQWSKVNFSSLIFSICILLCSPEVSGQNIVFIEIEEEADFPGGSTEMGKFINDNIDYPQEAIDLGIKGRVTVRFVVEETGQVSNVSVTIPLAGCKACDRAAVKVVEKMPAWIPAKIGGAAVGSWVTLPIKFEVQDESSKKSNHQGSGSSTINNGPAQEDNYTFLKACSYNYNEIPLGVQLVNSQEEWNNLSPYNACCCYPEFNASNKSLGLLYNYKAYEKISNRLKANSNGPLVITKEGWQDIFSKISADRNNIVALALNCYPGYFDEAWYTASEQFVGFWLDEQSMVSFSHNNYGEPMLDENIIGDRQNLVALSIRLNKGQQVSCEEDKWMVEPYIARGNNKSIKLITNSRDWDKYCSKEPCCCFLNFDYNNDQYGLLYNGLAMIQLKYDSELQKQGYRIATKADMDKLIGCRLKSGTFFDLFNCENDAINRFHISPNGYFGLDGWHAPEEGKTRYRLLDDDNSNLMYEFDCASKTYVQKMGKWGDAYAVKFIKR
jgi:TonB family protein